MNKLVVSLPLTVIVSLSICSASGQVGTNRPSAAATVQSGSQSSPHPNDQRETAKKDKEVPASDVHEKTWASEVWLR